MSAFLSAWRLARRHDGCFLSKKAIIYVAHSPAKQRRGSSLSFSTTFRRVDARDLSAQITAKLAQIRQSDQIRFLASFLASPSSLQLYVQILLSEIFNLI